jgi:hypothetical protein
MSKLHIITVANKDKYYFKYLKKTVEDYGGKLTVLGFGEEWKGYAWRFKLMQEKLKQIPSDDIVCFVDGFDVICVRDLQKLIQIFKEIKQREKCKIIGAIDIIPNKFFKPISTFFFTGKINKTVINAGTYIGYSKDILDMFNKIIDNTVYDNMDDQILLNSYSNKYPGNIYIDKNNEIFLTFTFLVNVEKHVEIINNEVIYKGSKPFFIHVAGNGNVDGVLKKLNYELTENIGDQLRRDLIKKSIYVIKCAVGNFLYDNRKKILLFLIMIILIIILIKYQKINKNI